MMTINITRMKELDDILNIMEPDADITDEQLEQLAGDADLRTAAEDIAIARRDRKSTRLNSSH